MTPPARESAFGPRNSPDCLSVGRTFRSGKSSILRIKRRLSGSHLEGHLLASTSGGSVAGTVDARARTRRAPHKRHPHAREPRARETSLGRSSTLWRVHACRPRRGRVSRVVSVRRSRTRWSAPRRPSLTAEALRLLDDPRDETRETKSRCSSDMWNPFRTDQMDALGDARDRMSAHEEDDAAGGKRQSRVGGNSAFDAVGSSFVAYLALDSDPIVLASREALMRTLAKELDCAASRDVGSRGSVALNPRRPAHDRDDVAVLFVGELKNKAELAENLPDRTPRTASPAPSSSTASTRTRPRLRLGTVGFFSFVVVDADAAVVRAVDRHASFPLVKGRCAGGGVFIAHAAGSNGARALRHNLGEATRVPGKLSPATDTCTRTGTPGARRRSARWRNGRRVGAAAARLRRGIGRHAGRIRPARSQSPLPDLPGRGRGGHRWNASESHVDPLEGLGAAAAPRVAVGVGSLRGADRDGIPRGTSAIDMNALRSWGAADRHRRGGGDDDDDAEMEESLQEPESRMGVAFHAAADVRPSVEFGAGTSTVIRDDASGSSAHGDGEHAHREHAREDTRTRTRTMASRRFGQDETEMCSGDTAGPGATRGGAEGGRRHAHVGDDGVVDEGETFRGRSGV